MSQMSVIDILVLFDTVKFRELEELEVEFVVPEHNVDPSTYE